MARFRATIQGNRGAASRLGHRTITSDTNGWNIGVNVFGFDSEGEDAFSISTTGGSNGDTRSQVIGHIVEGGQFEPSDYVIERILSRASACKSCGKIHIDSHAENLCAHCYYNGRGA